MLYCMDLQRYENAFRCITGADMCELTEQMLEDDLGIKSKLHRKRLMKIIRGEKDVRQLLNEGV